MSWDILYYGLLESLVGVMSGKKEIVGGKNIDYLVKGVVGGG